MSASIIVAVCNGEVDERDVCRIPTGITSRGSTARLLFAVLI